MKILAILEYPWQVPQFLDRMKRRPGLGMENLILFVPDRASQVLLEAEKISYKTETDFISPQTYEGVTSRSYFLAQNWWKSGPMGAADFNWSGVSLASLVQRDATYLFLWILRSISFTQTLLETVRPSEVWAGEKAGDFPAGFFHGGCEDFLYGEIAMDLAKEKAIPLEMFSAGAVDRLIGRMRALQKNLGFKIAGLRLHQLLLRSSPSSFWKRLKMFAADTLTGIMAVLGPWGLGGCSKEGAQAILISSSETHVAPVLSELNRREASRLVYIRETFSLKQIFSFLKDRIRFYAVSYYGLHLLPPKVRSKALELRRFWKQSAGFVLSDGIYEWRGCSFGRFLKRKYEFLFRSGFPMFMQLVESFREVLVSEKIKQILVEEDICVFNKALVNTARGLGIPSLVVQHGFTGIPVGFSPLSATCFAAFGPFAKRRLTEWGVPAERIAVTGNVLHDELQRAALPSREEFCRRLGLDPQKKIILLGMFPYRDYEVADFPEVESYSVHYWALLDSVVQALEAFPELQLVVKLHPRDAYLKPCREYVRRMRRFGVAVEKKGPAVHYVMHCDGLITVLSTLLIDALPFKKPMIVVDFSRQNAEKTRTLLSMNIPIIPNDKNLLMDSLREVLEKGSALISDDMITDHLYRVDGQAAKRVADLIEEFAGIFPKPGDRQDSGRNPKPEGLLAKN